MTMLWRERFPDISKDICGMCGIGSMEIVPITRNGLTHDIYRCARRSCLHEYVDVTHYDSKVWKLREKIDKKAVASTIENGKR